jgi:hypothetical protein
VPNNSARALHIKRLRRLSKRRDDETGRRRPTRLLAWERKDILTLHAAGYSGDAIARTLDRDPKTILRVIAEDLAAARKKDEKEYRKLHLRAATLAAENGDAKPAMDMLDRLGAVPVTSAQRTALTRAEITASAMRDQVTMHASRPTQPAGPSVQIGIGLPMHMGSSDLQVPLALPDSGVKYLTVGVDSSERSLDRHKKHLHTVGTDPSLT